MIQLFTALISGVGSLFSGIFNWKQEQAETVQKAIEAIAKVDENDAKSTAATAQALQVILSQGSWLEKNWRSWCMVLIMIMIGCSFFGYVPPHFNDPMSPQMQQMYDLLKLGLGGYIARRGIVDVVRMFNISAVLKTLINKKVL